MMMRWAPAVVVTAAGPSQLRTVAMPASSSAARALRIRDGSSLLRRQGRERASAFVTLSRRALLVRLPQGGERSQMVARFSSMPQQKRTSEDVMTEAEVALSSASSSSQRPNLDAKDLEATVIVLGKDSPRRQASLAMTDPAGTAAGVYDEDEEDFVEDGEEKLLSKYKSRPVEGGNWDPSDPLGWCRDFGSRNQSATEALAPLIQLGPNDEGYFDVSNVTVPKVTIIRTVEQARTVMNRLRKKDARDYIHACDTEVMSIDLKSEGPVGNGYVTCASVYSGPDFDYGLGDGPGRTLWIDNLDDACGVLQEFKDFFEDPKIPKVWHNYGFDRHVLWNEGINCLGFGGDTMHMARLQDTSRLKQGRGSGYSLEALTAADDLLGRRKRPMKELFGVPRVRKDGSEGSLVDVPPVEELQRDPRFRKLWIMYSAYDAEGTWLLHDKLRQKLEAMPWFDGLNMYEYYTMHMRPFGEVLTDMERRGIRVAAKDYLPTVEKKAREDRAQHVETFRQWVFQQIGPDGLALNPASSVQLCTLLFGGATNTKTKQPTEKVRTFKVPREEIPEDALEAYRKRDEAVKASDTGPDQNEVKYDIEKMKVAELKALCKEFGLTVSGKKALLQERLRGHLLTRNTAPEDSAAKTDADLSSMTIEELRDVATSRSLESSGTRAQLIRAIQEDSEYTLQLISDAEPRDNDGYRRVSAALEDALQDNGNLKTILDGAQTQQQQESRHVEVNITSLGMTPTKYTAGGAPSVTADVLRTLAGDPLAEEPKYGTAYAHFGGGKAGHDACVALYSLTAIGSIDTMIANFLTSLQSLADEDGRVHCSLNLNTETGRLSSRQPNLQNQPALEKDKYQIRRAFQASPGNNLIVADYGQLELRLLASMTNCKSMIEAFEAGGDFHSRTAMGMFDYIQRKVEEGECLLEWDYANGDPPKPMLKDEFGSERRKAKTLNFSIAYGKTVHGLSQDWGVSQQEAQEMLEAWYAARPEVLEWQEARKQEARDEGYTRTLMGRYRMLPEAKSRDRKFLGHAERASINTPIQGGAADVAMMAMVKINDSQVLKDLGWILLMQIHDELILEGPEETAEEAFAEVRKCMEEPWTFGLDKTAVPLLVDGSFSNKNWYDAK